MSDTNYTNPRASVWRFPALKDDTRHAVGPTPENTSSHVPVPQKPHAADCECDVCDGDEFDF